MADKYEVIIDEMEAKLRPPTVGLVPYEPKVIPLITGEDMLVREATREELILIMEGLKPLFDVQRDYYDIVAARMYTEILGMLRYRVRDEYFFVGAVDGELVGFVNGRLFSEKVGMSYHTLTLKRGVRVGAQLFAAKMEYHFDFMNQDEVWIVAESPNGFKRWMIEYELESRPECSHELGGVPTYVLTRALWEKHKDNKNVGIRPAFEDVVEANRVIHIPSKISV
ncbi:MAG: hypothetical protein FWE69_01350 [Clostridiales bacterium]|nr:hypothetical protein [Clostridiales bacterium]